MRNQDNLHNANNKKFENKTDKKNLSTIRLQNLYASFEDLPTALNSDYEIAKSKSNGFFKSFLISSITQIKYELRTKRLEFNRESSGNEKETLLEPCKELRIIKDSFKSELKKLGSEYKEDDFKDFSNFYKNIDAKLKPIKKEVPKTGFEERKMLADRVREFDDFVYRVEKDNKNLSDYCKVGTLFAQNLIRKEKNADGFGKATYYYREKESDKEKIFESNTEFYNYVAKKTGYPNPRQYLEHTFDNSGNKNLLSPKRLGEVVEYCKKHNYKIINPDFKP